MVGLPMTFFRLILVSQRSEAF